MNHQIFKPNYYDRFVCIADNCPMTCCQEWKITVDEPTLEKWKQTPPPSDTKPSYRSLAAYTAIQEGVSVISLNRDRRCPFLQKNQLCSLVLSYTDQILSETCSQFPRQFRQFSDRTEYSLASCCPEVIRLMKETDTVTILRTEETENIPLPQAACSNRKQQEFLLALKNYLISIMQDTRYSVEHALMMIFYILLDIRDKKISSCSELKQYVHSDILQELQQTLYRVSAEPLESFEERNELFLDLTENYRKEGLYTHALKNVVSLAENHTVSYDSAHILAQLAAFHADMKSWEHLFRNYLVSELFSELLLPDSDEKDMIIMTEWIAMEYAAIRHLLFLQAQMHKKMSDFSLIRNTIVIISRMMGYEQEDIIDYMTNSFQSALWDWGYLALLVI